MDKKIIYRILHEGLTLLYKQFLDRYFDLNTLNEFPKSEINEHPNWWKEEYDKNGNKTYFETDSGAWQEWEYDKNGNEIYSKTSSGWWSKKEYDNNGFKIYWETSDRGVIINHRDQIQEGLMLPYKKYQNYLSGIANVLINQDWDTRYDAAQQREHRFNIKEVLVKVFKDPEVMVRVADLYEWSDGNNGFISFNNLNHYITDLGFKSFADNPTLYTDTNKLKQHILYAYASSAGGNLRRGEQYRNFKYNPNDDFEM